MKNHTTVVKSGRAFNASHRDAGRIVHLIEDRPANVGGDWFDRALCGTIPGRRGNGWSRTLRGATCDACISELSHL